MERKRKRGLLERIRSYYFSSEKEALDLEKQGKYLEAGHVFFRLGHKTKDNQEKERLLGNAVENFQHALGKGYKTVIANGKALAEHWNKTNYGEFASGRDATEIYKAHREFGQVRQSRKRESSSWDNESIIVLIIGLVGGLFFLSSNLTGNVIGNLNQTSSNWIGGFLFLIGLVGAFAYFKRR